MNINYLDIGKRIRVARIAKGITQEKLAELVEAGTTHISHIETGNTIPSMKTFIAIVNALGTSADELLCDNIVKSKDVFQDEITQAAEDCDEKEIRIIADMVKALKESLRKREQQQNMNNRVIREFTNNPIIQLKTILFLILVFCDLVTDGILYLVIIKAQDKTILKIKETKR